MEENEAKVCSFDCVSNSIFMRIWNPLRYFVRNTINHFKKSNGERIEINRFFKEDGHDWAEINGDEYW